MVIMAKANAQPAPASMPKVSGTVIWGNNYLGYTVQKSDGKRVEALPRSMVTLPSR
jgi:hypothetical protein